MFWSQFVSVCFGMKFFSSFKIHCLQMLQLFQTRDGPFFFIVTLVYTCRAFFAVSSKNIYPIYCFGHSSSQSVWQSWRRYLLQLSRRYSVTKMQPSGNLLSFNAVSKLPFAFSLSANLFYFIKHLLRPFTRDSPPTLTPSLSIVWASKFSHCRPNPILFLAETTHLLSKHLHLT